MGSEKVVKVEKRGKKFSLYFTVTTSILIAVAIILTAFYSTNCITTLMKDFKISLDSYSGLITNMVVKSLPNGKSIKSFEKMDSTVNFLIDYANVKYVLVYDLSTDNIVWSTQKTFVGRNYKDFSEKYLYNININKGLETKSFLSDSYGVIVASSKNSLQSKNYAEVFESLKLFVIIFLLFGALISYLMSLMLNKPLTDLTLGVQEFAKGDFSHKLQESGFDEFDKLVVAYNDMASQLSELYESLEVKVEERTKELEEANNKLKETQTMMVHSEKMRSLGELVAGIAHEINNPINFIYGNIMILDNYQKDLLSLIDKYSSVDKQIDQVSLKEIDDIKQKIDIDFLKDDIGDLIKSCIEGVERTKNIILDLKNFSRMDEMVFSECDIPKEIDTTLNILNNKIKNRITVHKNYEANVPKIEAFGGQLNQVFMNILDNAQGAIKGVGDIYITAKKVDNMVQIEFEDTGCGIKQENLNKIFEPFYTTKPVGQGTGLGMSITYKVIEAHNGKIFAESEIDKGTKITIMLPIIHQKKDDK